MLTAGPASSRRLPAFLPLALLGALAAVAGCGSSSGSQDEDLDSAIESFVARGDGPPGLVVIVQRGDDVHVDRVGIADVEQPRIVDIGDYARLADLSKAFSGAAALAVVADGELDLDDTVGERLPDLPNEWHDVTLRQLLNHTGGIPDFTATAAFAEALDASPLVAPPPRQLLDFISDPQLTHPAGAAYEYSNSDNVIVGLMIEAATGQSYEQVLADRVFGPLGLGQTSLPAGATLPSPFMHGYTVQPPGRQDVSQAIAAGWLWASGGIVSTPGDLSRFVRAYVRGATTDEATHDEQFEFVAGDSEPSGPGTNAAGLGIFRYETRCGTVYGHTGSFPGYTQFAAASRDGERSVTVSVNSQFTESLTPGAYAALREIYELGACFALGKGGDEEGHDD